MPLSDVLCYAHKTGPITQGPAGPDGILGFVEYLFWQKAYGALPECLVFDLGMSRRMPTLDRLNRSGSVL